LAEQAKIDRRESLSQNEISVTLRPIIHSQLAMPAQDRREKRKMNIHEESENLGGEKA
jgi:hypothetical protein